MAHVLPRCLAVRLAVQYRLAGRWGGRAAARWRCRPPVLREVEETQREVEAEEAIAEPHRWSPGSTVTQGGLPRYEEVEEGAARVGATPLRPF